MHMCECQVKKTKEPLIVLSSSSFHFSAHIWATEQDLVQNFLVQWSEKWLQLLIFKCLSILDYEIIVLNRFWT